MDYNSKISSIKEEYTNYFNEKDDQSLFYFNQVMKLLYDELSHEVSNKKTLSGIISNNFKNNIMVVFKNMKSYFLKTSDNSIKSFDEILKMSVSNKYIDTVNLNGLYNNFTEEINSILNIKSKIEVLIKSNANSLIEQIHLIGAIKDSEMIKSIVDKYMLMISTELNKNVTSKCSFVISTYKNLIDNLFEESNQDKRIIDDMNMKLINNTALVYLKEQEYFNINKYIKDNFDMINNTFSKLEEDLSKKLSIKKANKNLNKTKDYLLGFNNTVGIKIKNIFDEMNEIINLDGKEADKKLREFSDNVSHVYETNLVFDKQFLNYKKEFNILSRDYNSFNKIFESETKKLTEAIKESISNIFRDNVKLFNDIIYKTLLLKSRVGEFSTILSEEKVKDLLLK